MSSKDGFVCYLSLGCLVFFFFCWILSLQPIRASIVKTHNASQIAMQELNQNQFHQFCLYGLIENKRWTDSVCPSSWREERKQTGGQEEKEQKETDSERERERERRRERDRGPCTVLPYRHISQHNGFSVNEVYASKNLPRSSRYDKTQRGFCWNKLWSLVECDEMQ